MVMEHEHPPAPSSVGREFVRQYYTLLNQAPSHLHRFYNNNSSFIHGGLDSPQRPEAKVVIGQKLIHQKIQQLNFRDCHAKISQVDSQATLGDGVVVQVTGELSNSGQPMRRFTQTFVLAAQTPKKFYVHNDIFRYQDMLCNEEEEELPGEAEEIEAGRGGDEVSEGEGTDIPIQQAGGLAPQHGYFNNNVAPHHIVTQPPQPAAPAPVVTAQPVVPIVNGSAHPDELPHVVPVVTQPVVVPVLAPPPVVAAPAVTPPPRAPVVEEEPAAPVAASAPELPPPVVEPAPEEPKKEEEKVEVAPVEPVNEPKTYATLLKSGPISFASAAGGGSGFTAPSAPAPAPVPKQSEYAPLSRPEHRDGFASGRGGMGRPQRGGSVRGVGRDSAPTNSRPLPQQPQQQQQPRASFSEEHDATNNTVGGANDGLDRDRRRGPGPVTYSDSQQLFLGNLPHNITAGDLKEVFRKFGNIVDVHIHSKPQGKGVVPNFGFMTFELASSVQEVLANRPFYFPDDNGIQLNVEEKKFKGRHSMEPSSRLSDSAPSRSDYRGGPPALGGGPPPPRGIMRGGSVARGGGRGAAFRGTAMRGYPPRR